ncbi:MAG: DUF3737 family protein [Ruminococcus flavefaciens]|nr:DUF3737 family protein [Ruminococcus flavefaciens]
MKIIVNKTFDEERALYNSDGIVLKNCAFDGIADGESALKESRNIQVYNCYCNLCYPFWHDKNIKIIDSEMTELCRAGLWYSSDIEVNGSKLHGIKALRECSDVKINNCDIISTEFGWSVNNISMTDCHATSEYFMMRSSGLNFRNVTLNGKYSFQYINNSLFEDCNFNTKDAFWHAENITVRNSVVRGEYLAWYSKNITFENCIIIGTQPFCYCDGLKLINCEMHDTDLCFEKSEVEAYITTPVISIKNAKSGSISVPEVNEIICDDECYKAEITVRSLQEEK